MKYLVDTNVVSELRKGARANPGVRAWAASTPSDEAWLSVLTLAEIRHGIERLRRRDPASAEALDRWYEGLRDDYADRIVTIDLDVAERWAMLGLPDPMPVVDGLLAATALVGGFTLVTRNRRDMERSGVETLDPF